MWALIHSKICISIYQEYKTEQKKNWTDILALIYSSWGKWTINESDK